MLTITYTKKERTYKLEMKGHCNTAPKGEDLVCAAASILCLTMAQVLEDNAEKLRKKPKVEIADGDVTLAWQPKAKFEGALSNCLYTVVTGLDLLDHNHPECIEFIKK